MKPLFADLKAGADFKPVYRFFGFYGGRLGFKSHGAAIYAILSAMTRHEIIVTGRQYKNSNDDSTKALFQNKIRQLGLESAFYITKTEIIYPPTESKFRFVGLEANPESIRSFEGATLTVLEEAHMLRQIALDVLIPTVMRTPTWRIIANWNCISPETPIDNLFRGANPYPKMYSARLNYWDNPYWREETFTDTRAIIARDREANYNKYLHKWEGEYINAGETRIFNNWEVGEIRLTEKMFPQYGLDFGSRNDPNAAVRLYVDESRKLIYIDKEYYAAGNLEVADNALAAILLSPRGKVVADGSWPQTVSWLQKKYPGVTAAKKGANSILEGIRWLQDFKIIIHPRCSNMVREANRYSWKIDVHRVTDDGMPVVLEQPEDKDNHLWDAVRYATEQNRLEKIAHPTIRHISFPKRASAGGVLYGLV